MDKKPIISSWIPDRPTSQGASQYHDAVVKASWHVDNIAVLISTTRKNIKKGSIVVDFGAGTGASALYFLKEIKKDFTLWLTDNSPSWLGKSYEILHQKKNVAFFVLKKVKDNYEMLHEVIGNQVADMVICANTVHLIPDVRRAFKGIYSTLKPEGVFAFQSGNIIRGGREKGLMMIDDSVIRVHDIAIQKIRKDAKLENYRKKLDQKIKINTPQRKIVFPNPRPVEFYLNELKAVGFKNPKISFKRIKVRYDDWFNFLKVRRLQAGILPEIGGKEPTPREEKDRDNLISDSAKKLFEELKNKNPFSNKKTFTAEWTYIVASK